MSRQEHLPPNFGRLDSALRSIGYSFESAVADIVDNSLDAGALDIRVRFLQASNQPLDLVVWDGGRGMDAATLQEAMRFGADLSQEMTRLGKFGLGLKLASLSQAKALHVYTWRDGGLHGRGWLEKGISDGFSNTIFTDTECAQAVNALSHAFPQCKSGTLVHWSHLNRIKRRNENSTELVQHLLKRLNNHLGITFHRFIKRPTDPATIHLDILDLDSGEVGLPKVVEALDPFGYKRSGDPAFPASMTPEEECPLTIRAHIWSPNSDLKEYRLPGGANSRQGFYFYRNNRLVQAGGWNGIREAEPHSSLARLEVDVGPELDLDFSLDVKKSEIRLPPHLAFAIERSRTANGIDFKKYLGLAKKAYSSRQRMHGDLPLIPSDGMPARLRDVLKEELRITGVRKTRDLRFEWTELPDDRFFDLDRDNDVLYLNQAFRRQLLHGLKGSSADLPVVKSLLFLLLRDSFHLERVGSKAREHLDQINRILIEAVKCERR